MTTFYMFLNTVATLFVSAQFVTVLTFPHRIEFLPMGTNKLDMYRYLSKDRKTLVLKPLRRHIDTNMTVITSRGNYSFNIKSTLLNPHKSVRVLDGRKDDSYKLLRKRVKYKILEGENTYLFINSTKGNMSVNGTTVKGLTTLVVPKGPPVFINGHREID